MKNVPVGSVVVRALITDSTPSAMVERGLTSELSATALKLLRGENVVLPPERKGMAMAEKVLNSYVSTYELVDCTR